MDNMVIFHAYSTVDRMRVTVLPLVGIVSGWRPCTGR